MSGPNYTDVINVACVRQNLSCTVEQEMVSIPVDNAPAFLQLRDKYKQELVEDIHLTKAVDLASKQHVLLASDVPDAWKRPQLKAVGRQLRHWTKKVRQPFGALVSGVRATGAPATSPGEDDFDAGPAQAWLTHWSRRPRVYNKVPRVGDPPDQGENHPYHPNPSSPPVPKRNFNLRLR